MMTTGVTHRPQLSEEVADLVGNRIMSGELRPGDFIRLDETALGLGVSVTPVREALLTLRSEGLVDLVPRRGYTVSPLSRRDIEDMFWVQSAIAQKITRRSFETMDDGDRDILVRLAAEFGAAAERGDIDTVVSTQHLIFRAVNKGSNSPKLVRLLAGASRYVPYRMFATDPAWCASQALINSRIGEAATRGEVGDAVDAVIEQFDDACARLIDYLDEAGIWDEEPAAS